MSYSSKIKRLISVSAVLGFTVVISGCNQSLARRDSISSSFGNALAANTALQTVDPWSRRVENTHIHTDGTNASNAIESYRTPPPASSGEATPIDATEIAPSN